MANLDLTAANPALKEYYDDQKVQNLVYEERPTLAMMPKDTNAGGKYVPIPTIFETSQGAGADFATAQANQTAAQLAEFLVTVKKDYSFATIDNLTLEAAASDKMSFIRTSTLAINGAVRKAANRDSTNLFRSGTGSIGALSGNPSSGVCTLSNAADIVHIAVGQTLQVSGTDGGAPRAALGYVIARSVGLTTSTFTVSATAQGGSAGSPSLWASGDYILTQSDSNAVPAGFAGWLPATAPAAGSNFYGVDRSVDSRLYGLYFDGSGEPIEEAIVDHSILMGREGASPDHFITNYGSYGALIKALGTRKQNIEFKGPGTIGFEGVLILGAGSPIRVFPDRCCQVKTGYMLKMDTWKIYSVGDVPRILRYTDGNDMLRVYNADAAECRVATYWTGPTCNAPGWNGQLGLGA